MWDLRSDYEDIGVCGVTSEGVWRCGVEGKGL